MVGKLYSLPQQILDTLKFPTVDAPMADPSTHTVIPSEGEGGPMWQMHRDVIEENFWSASFAFRALAVFSLMQMLVSGLVS